ncbi:hypothetical protein EJ05DRAFT_509588 [Pseudovirgaria hyperparasitica]|uniref:Altered inheritance of mitochondria protein 24, mitochondrial n=1 Tax=Pseudovirgaria hyperparasitica TaxID=470096 RepID=A0A6A6WE97_9PEZI|nr:uncharacterized protein EJ05DRAFT_509588 [Pseudovirgaria hyperparasitica]KAF2759907.1 hypothetical protein EJ05DRAFT_509588 [Pseudovirgaria hyperparasitica]
MRISAARSIWSSCALGTAERRPILSHPSSIGRRYIQITDSPATRQSPEPELPSQPYQLSPEPGPDARFEVLGAPYSLLSVQLSASQNLYTQRGTLIAVTGQAENAVSTLSLLEPFRRALVGIPFLYQKISSTSPITALISPKSPISSASVIHLDGRRDWIVAQRNALIAWTGHDLSVKPKINTKMSISHWGNSHISGRGLLALAGSGNIYQIQLKAGEQYVVHPANVIAYSVSRNLPQPYRFKSNILRFQVPTASLGRFVPDNKFFRTIGESPTWRYIRSMFFVLRTWARRTIWGDRLFLQFTGPTSILLQSRGSRLTDVLTTRDVIEIGDSPPGVVYDIVHKEAGHGSSDEVAKDAPLKETVRFANVGNDGKVDFKKD